MIRLGPLLARRGHLGGARGGGAILRLSGWGCFTFISSPSPFGDMIGHKGRERQGGRSRRVRRTVSSSGTVTLAGRFMSAMLSTGFAPGTVTGPTRAFLAGFRHGIIISVWTDRSPEGTAPVGNSPLSLGASPALKRSLAGREGRYRARGQRRVPHSDLRVASWPTERHGRAARALAGGSPTFSEIKSR